jgi:hypothetical protein
MKRGADRPRTMRGGPSARRRAPGKRRCSGTYTAATEGPARRHNGADVYRGRRWRARAGAAPPDDDQPSTRWRSVHVAGAACVAAPRRAATHSPFGAHSGAGGQDPTLYMSSQRGQSALNPTHQQPAASSNMGSGFLLKQLKRSQTGRATHPQRAIWEIARSPQSACDLQDACYLIVALARAEARGFSSAQLLLYIALPLARWTPWNIRTPVGRRCRAAAGAEATRSRCAAFARSMRASPATLPRRPCRTR